MLSESRFKLCKMPVLSLSFWLLSVWVRELACSDDGSKVALFSMVGELPGELRMSDALLILLLTAGFYKTDSDCHVMSSWMQGLRRISEVPCAQGASAMIGPVV